MSVYSQHDVYVLLYLAIVCIGAAIVIAILGYFVGRLMDRRDARHQLDDEYAALDHNEPSRRAIERAAMDALARAEAERDLDQFAHDCEAAFLDAMTAGRPYLRAIRAAQDEARSLDAEWEQIQANGWRS